MGFEGAYRDVFFFVYATSRLRHLIVSLPVPSI